VSPVEISQARSCVDAGLRDELEPGVSDQIAELGSREFPEMKRVRRLALTG
jgi:hypothetical protein